MMTRRHPQKNREISKTNATFTLHSQMTILPYKEETIVYNRNDLEQKKKKKLMI